jgi:osmotically-inducible protein OsmY
MAALVLGLLTGAAIADPPAGTPPSDQQLALQARYALWDNPTWEKLNLGVTVRQGVAFLSGPVPSSAVADEAIERLRKVTGIRDVKNETYLPPSDEPLSRSMPHPVTTQRPSVSVVSAVVTPESVPPPVRAAGVTAPQKTPAVMLGPPVAAVPVKRMSLPEQIEALRFGDRRYQNIRVELRDGVVILRGRVARSSDAWDFAATVRQLPGVGGVVQSVMTDPR